MEESLEALFLDVSFYVFINLFTVCNKQLYVNIYPIEQVYVT